MSLINAVLAATFIALVLVGLGYELRSLAAARKRGDDPSRIKRLARRTRRRLLGLVFLALAVAVLANTSPMHSHESEQMTYVFQGALRFLINGEEITVREGAVLHIPSWVPHQAEALDDTFEMDMFSPIRQDWLDGTDTYFHKK